MGGISCFSVGVSLTTVSPTRTPSLAIESDALSSLLSGDVLPQLHRYEYRDVADVIRRQRLGHRRHLVLAVGDGGGDPIRRRHAGDIRTAAVSALPFLAMAGHADVRKHL